MGPRGQEGLNFQLENGRKGDTEGSQIKMYCLSVIKEMQMRDHVTSEKGLYQNARKIQFWHGDGEKEPVTVGRNVNWSNLCNNIEASKFENKVRKTVQRHKL